MDDSDQKGKQFLELINKQNNLQWNIISKLSLLIDSNWNSVKLQTELEELTSRHCEITKLLNNIE